MPDDLDETERVRRAETKKGKRVYSEVAGPDSVPPLDECEGRKEDEDYEPKVSHEDACKFLKLVRHSEFKVVEQLNRTPARISLLSLMITSEPHRRALIRVLN